MTGEIRSRKIWLASLALAAAGIACSLGAAKATPTPRPTAIPVSSEAAGQLEGVWATAVAGSNDGEVTVIVTELQLTSFIGVQTAANPDSPIKDPQVILRDGKMHMTANATVSSVKVPVAITLSAAPNAEGALKITIDDAKLGSLPMPQALLDSVAATINEAVAGQFGPEVTGVKISAVTIADGQMVLTGTLTK